MNLGQRSTFGATSPEIKQTTQTSDRVEAGALWKRYSKSSGMEFFSIKLKFSKEKLKQLLEKEGESIDLGFIAFSNNSKQADDKRPDFKIFEDKE
jgi:uncharacterized protein (DUF736 family)